MSKILGGQGMIKSYFKLVLFQGSFISPLHPETLSSLPTDIHMHKITVQMPATICKFHQSHLSQNQHIPSLPYFSPNKLSPAPCQNSRTSADLLPQIQYLFSVVKSVSVLNWNVLSTGEMFMHLHLMHSFKSLQGI